MEIDLKLCRFESAPWGFRLIGGADFDLPLTVVKVAEESLAEQAGMRVGDVILKINDESTAGKSHTDIQKIIGNSGNNFFITVYREENQEEENYVEELVEVSQSSEVHEMHQTSICQQEVTQSVRSEAVTQTNGIQLEECIEHITEAEIADIISSEAEVLKEHNVIGVNFNRIFPKPGVCKSSEVFRTLNDEAIQTKADKEKEKRKWTTFLQKPDRPIPKSKHELEQERNFIPYKVQIVKQPKPRVAPGRTPTPPPIVPEPEPEPEKSPTPEVVEEEPAEPPTDSEVPNLEPDDIPAGGTAIETIEGIENVNEGEMNEAADQLEEERKEPIEVAPAPEPPQKTVEEIMFAKQLTDIQRQLLALSSLPSTIQATLDAVSKQLCELMPSIQLELPAIVENGSKSEETTQPEQRCENAENNEKMNGMSRESTETTQDTVIEASENLETTEESMVQREEISEQKSMESQVTETRQESHIIQQATEERTIHEQTYEYEEEFAYEEHKSKSQQQLVMKELEHKQRLIKERASKRPPRAFGPLTPQERPLILPGGRKWRGPKDAFNDEFIADILSSQAELIVGSTLGVNFLKYKKPEKHIDLEKSEVYKVIHHLDHSPKRGIEFRPERVVAEADVRNGTSPGP